MSIGTVEQPQTMSNLHTMPPHTTFAVVLC